MANFAKDFTEQHPELVSKGICKRAKHGIHFGRGNGDVDAIFTGAPMHYLEGRLWEPIDTNLRELPGGWYGAPHLDIKLHPDGRVKAGGYEQFAELPGSPIGKVHGNQIIREFNFGQQRLILTESGFRQETEITRPPTVKELAKLIAVEKGSLLGQYNRRAKVRDAKGSLVDYKSVKDISDFLKDAVYPVVIDPDFSAGSTSGEIVGINAVYATARSTSNDSDQNVITINAGQYVSGSNYIVKRSFLAFDTSSIPDSNIIYKVNLTLTISVDASAVNFDVQIVKTDWSSNTDFSNATQRENAYDACLADAADDNKWRNTSGVSENTPYTSGSLNNNWISKTGTTYYGLRSSRDKSNTTPTDNEYVEFYSNGYVVTAHRPILAVLYSSNKPGVIAFT